MKQSTEVKSSRLLSMYGKLSQGEILNKAEQAQHFHVTQRSIQRDMEALRCFFAEEGLPHDIIYDRQAKGYRLLNQANCYLNNGELLAVCKILLESRSMARDEMMPILDKIIQCCVPTANQKLIQSLVSNEKFHYIEPHHGKLLTDLLLEIGMSIENHSVLTISYEKLSDPVPVQRTVEPVGLLFSEYYFYLVAFLRDVNRAERFDNPNDCFPTIYRIDRIRHCELSGEKFHPPYATRFEEGEFRKRIQFMYGGTLQTIRFRYSGPSIEAVLDRLPTAVIQSEDENGWTVSAEVFGKGIDMWMRSQGDYITRL